jgi:hypothetical protein
MKQLLIIGARGFGREFFYWAKECHGYGTAFGIKGFLDDKADALDRLPGYGPIISSVEGYEVQPGDVFTCALGDVRQKKRYVEMIRAKGFPEADPFNRLHRPDDGTGRRMCCLPQCRHHR